MALSGAAIGIFKTGALALIGDISKSTAEHTAIMNTVEGFFGVGSIIGPALLAQLLKRGVPWQWLYVIAGSMCVLLIVTALRVQYPTRADGGRRHESAGRPAVSKNRFVLVFSLGAFLYVAVESAIYVWMPTLFAGYHGPGRVDRRLQHLDLLPATRRRPVSGSVDADQTRLECGSDHLQRRRSWRVSPRASRAACTGPCTLLPLSGLFMSVIYPTVNSKGISCVPKSEHGAAAGVILFFTCLSAVLAPLAIGAISDAMGGPIYGFMLATGFAALLFVGMLLNHFLDPTSAVLGRADETEYAQLTSGITPT